MIMGRMGTLEGPIIEITVYYGVRELFTETYWRFQVAGI